MIKFKKLHAAWLLGLVAVFFSFCNEIVPTNPGNDDDRDLSEVLAKYGPPEQTFTKDATSSFTINSANGFSYFFPNGVLTKDGQAVTGNVDVEITEYLTKADMIFSGVTTASGNSLLQSGGMFNIEISQDGEDLDLAGMYTVSIPTTEGIDPQMQVFRGEENPSNGQTVNWVQADSSWVRSDSTVGGGDTSRYYLTLNFLSWCNLDKYYNAATGTQVRLKLPEGYASSNTVVYMIFEENSVVYLMADVDKKEFNSGNFNLPLGWDIHLLAVAKTDNGMEYGLVSSTISDPHYEELTSLTPISEEELKDLIKDL